ncbi:MAG: hypothetical protein JEY96_09300 [Bacteroidales bacterium]|nr:hypothetical protein [Bacteroidales bacterium]
MKAVTAKELKQELGRRTPNELLDLCLRLARFKKENKELLTYLLFESSDEFSYVENVKTEIDQQFDLVNKKTPYLIKKSIRKILQNTKKYIRYSLKKETEVELLIYFCTKLKNFKPSMHRNVRLQNMYIKQIEMISKKIEALHEDLQFDFGEELRALSN